MSTMYKAIILALALAMTLLFGFSSIYDVFWYPSQQSEQNFQKQQDYRHQK